MQFRSPPFFPRSPSRKHRHKSRFGGRRAAAPRRPAGGRAGPARRRRPGGGFEDDEASAYSEDAPLFGGRKGKHGSASDTDNIDDETLLKTFKNVLKDGIQVIQHLAKGRPQQVRLLLLLRHYCCCYTPTCVALLRRPRSY